MRTVDEIKSDLAWKRSFLAESQEHSDIVRLDREIKKLETELCERWIIEAVELDNMRLAKEQITRLEEANKIRTDDKPFKPDESKQMLDFHSPERYSQDNIIEAELARRHAGFLHQKAREVTEHTEAALLDNLCKRAEAYATGDLSSEAFVREFRDDWRQAIEELDKEQEKSRRYD